MQNFVQCRAVESEIELPQEFFEKTEKHCSLLSYIYANCITVIYNNIYFVHIFFCNCIRKKPRSDYLQNS